MEPEGSLAATGSYSEPDESSPDLHIGTARLSAYYDFNKSIYISDAAACFPDEIDWHGCDKER
jgi:hypothetical protein